VPDHIDGRRLIGSERRAGSVRSVETVVLLVAVATVVAAFAGRLRLPAPSLLVVAGVAAGLLPGAPPVHVPPAVVSLVVVVVVPPLYAASEELAWRDVRAVWRPVVVLAVGLVLASAAAAAAVADAVAPLSASMDHDPETAREAVTERELRGELIAAENAELSRLFDTGTITAATRRRLQRSLDLEAARLAEGRP